MWIFPFWGLQQSSRTSWFCDEHLGVAFIQELQPSLSCREWTHQLSSEKSSTLQPRWAFGPVRVVGAWMHGWELEFQPSTRWSRMQSNVLLREVGSKGLEIILPLEGSKSAREVNKSWLWNWLRSAVLLSFQMIAFYLFHQCQKLAHKISSPVPLKISVWAHPKWWDGLKNEKIIIYV